MTIPLEDIIVTFLVFTRMAAFMLSIPLLSGRIIPRTVRLGIAFTFALLVAPMLRAVPQPAHYVELILITGSELMIGLLMGMAVRAVFATVDFAGHTMSMEIGLIRSTSLNPLSDFSGSGTLGVVLFYLSVLIFMVTGMHHQVLSAMVRSFTYLPLGVAIVQTSPLPDLLDLTSNIFLVGMLMSAPFIAVNFLINTTFAVMGRVSPKMNVFMISFAVRILAGLAVLISTATLLTHYIYNQFQGTPQDVLNLLAG